MALTAILVSIPVAGAGEGEAEMLAKMHAERDAKWKESLSKYIPAPKKLKGIPGAQRVHQKTGRARWKDSNGDILEWDSQHGEVEVYDKSGKHHKGAKNPDTGEWTKGPKEGRTTEK